MNDAYTIAMSSLDGSFFKHPIHKLFISITFLSQVAFLNKMHEFNTR